jgi:hypothetical protein
MGIPKEAVVVSVQMVLILPVKYADAETRKSLYQH